MKATKLAVITGASRGIGRAISKQLAMHNWRCLLIGRDSEKLKQVIAGLSGEHDYLALDITAEDAATQIARKAATMGGVDLLVNNAGINTMAGFAEILPTDLKKQMETNLLAPMLVSQACLPQLISSHGTIVNLGSAFGSIGFPYQSSYCASKFGLRGFTEALTRELDNQVAVKYLAPRATTTEMNDDRATAVNHALGNQMDSPEVVAQAFMKLLHSNTKRAAIGFPERFFARLNGLLPELVDNALIKKVKTIQTIFSTKESLR
ncbi:SDR family oxidoreductase [Pseudoalteromonas sp. A22]|uniref:SDR family oxidoreductase n=1 Tax=Pseudoalteromonas sp. A22 TaxID=327511 RepID=UPI001BA9FFF3|nr:SDR family oxidoreductase [Pseudoalteromonas sp. A22]QUI61660.1 SDR family oxidoreductase [Pseudoalteromonas sp. A22]